MRVFNNKHYALAAMIILLSGCGGHSDNASSSGTISLTAASDLADKAVGECAIPPLPAMADLPPISTLPNPFMFMDGTAVATKEQWACRRAEIAAQAQH